MRNIRDTVQRVCRAVSSRNICKKLFFILTALQAGVVWLHPVFPTQDGPMQLYYVDVLEDLIRGGGHYSSYFTVQGYLHPYSFFNYSLLLLNQLFQPLTSERILVSVYFVVFSLGARFLVRSLNPENHWLTLFIIPFAFNTYLCLGIYNFSFAIATLMFALGLWLRWSGEWTFNRLLSWLALLMLLAWMHPVAIAILGIFTAAHVVATFRAAYGVARVADVTLISALRRIRADLPAAGLLIVPAAWIAEFALIPSGKLASAGVFPADWPDRIRALAGMVPLSPYLSFEYCVCLLLLVLIAFALTYAAPGRSSVITKSAPGTFALTATGLTCLAIYTFGPRAVLGAGYFAYRMAVPAVICFLAGRGAYRVSAPREVTAAVSISCIFLFILAVREHQTAHMSAELVPLYESGPVVPKPAGAIIAGAQPMDGLTFNPYYWSGAEYARRRKAILLNAPWIDSPLMVVGRKTRNAWDNAEPWKFRQMLSSNSNSAMPRVDFVCGGKWDPAQPELTPSDPLARSLGIVRVFDSSMFYCYEKPAGSL